MSRKLKFIDWQWRYSLWFFRIFPLWLALILGINIWHDAALGKPFDWLQVFGALGMVVFSTVLFFASRLIFRTVRKHVEVSERGAS